MELNAREKKKISPGHLVLSCLISREKRKAMKSRQKELLVRARPELLKTLDVNHVIPALRESGHLTAKDEAAIHADAARRKKVTKLLDLLEKKRTEAFDVFAEALEERYTHLYLELTGFEPDDDHPLDDEWTTFRRARNYLIDEIDAMKVAPALAEKGIINDEEFNDVKTAGDTDKKTEVLLDILETKSTTAVDIVIDTIGESYPHLYLILSGNDDLC